VTPELEPLEVLILVLAWVAFMLTVLMTCWTLDKLVRLQYASHRTKWEEDGKPSGFFFRPPETRVLGGLFVTSSSSWAFQKCSFLWVLSTPEWMQEDQRALELVIRLRVLTLASTAGVGVWLLLAFLGLGARI
jgi:hypothetical protein